MNLKDFKWIKKATDVFYDRPTADKDCALCHAGEVRTRLHEDNTCWATYCDSCPGDVIMVVLKHHYRVPTPEEEQHMMRIGNFLSTVQGKKTLRGYSNEDGATVKASDPRAIPDHFHMHFREV